MGLGVSIAHPRRRSPTDEVDFLGWLPGPISGVAGFRFIKFPFLWVSKGGRVGVGVGFDRVDQIQLVEIK
jgi:hypothetical protein